MRLSDISAEKNNNMSCLLLLQQLELSRVEQLCTNPQLLSRSYNTPPTPPPTHSLHHNYYWSHCGFTPPFITVSLLKQRPAGSGQEPGYTAQTKTRRTIRISQSQKLRSLNIFVQLTLNASSFSVQLSHCLGLPRPSTAVWCPCPYGQSPPAPEPSLVFAAQSWRGDGEADSCWQTVWPDSTSSHTGPRCSP